MFIDTRLPERYEQGAIARPLDSTEVVVTDGGHEQRNERWAYPLHEFELNLVPTRTDDADYLALRDLYYQARTAHTFKFRDWNDYELVLEQIGVGDGATTDFQIIKYYGSAAVPGGRKISRLEAVTAVTVNGVAAGYTVDLATGILSLNAAAAVGHEIRVSATFDVEVRFAEPVDFAGIDPRIRHARNIRLIEVKA